LQHLIEEGRNPKDKEYIRAKGEKLWKRGRVGTNRVAETKGEEKLGVGLPANQS